MAQTAVFSGSGPSYSDTPNYGTAGKWMVSYEIGPRRYKREFITANGVDGQGSKTLAFQEQAIVLNVVYVADSADTVTGNMMTDEAALNAAVLDLALAGQTFYACFVEDFKKMQPKSTGLSSGKFRGEANITISSKRLA